MTFNPHAFGFNADNALLLAELSAAAYLDDGDELTGTLARLGLAHARHRVLSARAFGVDTQALVVGDAEWCIVAFRGSEPKNLVDWVTDAQFLLIPGPGGDVHAGFLRGLQVVLPELLQALREWRDADQPLWLTGHSLGGALATLATATLKFREQPLPVQGLYTFGCPRPGSERFATNFNAAFRNQTFRFVNNNDVVTRVPSSRIGYGHVGTLMYFDADGTLHRDAELSWWSEFWDRLKGRFEHFPSLLLDDVGDHFKQAYVDFCRKAVA